MRFVGILLLLSLVIYVGQLLYYRNEANTALAAAVGSLPDNPSGAYSAIKPVFTMSAGLSGGRATSARDEFFTAVRDKTIARLHGPRLDAAAFPSIVGNLEILADARRNYHFNLDAHSKAIAGAIVEAEPEFRKTLGLAAWDAFVAAMEKCRNADSLPADAIPDADVWYSKIKSADRWQIGLREAKEIAARQLDAANSLLGKAPATGPGDPAIGFIDRELTDDEFIAMDSAIAVGVRACGDLLRTFHHDEPPADLVAPMAKLIYNAAALKLAHFNRLRQSGQIDSGYIVKILFNPAIDTPPTTEELYGSFVNLIQGELDRLASWVQRPGWTPDDLVVMRALVLRAQGIYWSLRDNPTAAQAAMGQYQTVRPSGGKLLAPLDSSQFIPIFLR